MHLELCTTACASHRDGDLRGSPALQDGRPGSFDSKAGGGSGNIVHFAFRNHDHAGEPVTDYVEELTKELHLYVVNEDLTVFRHLHPTRADDGTWSAPFDVPAAGGYRVITGAITVGTLVTFNRTADSAKAEGNDIFPSTSKTLPACPAAARVSQPGQIRLRPRSPPAARPTAPGFPIFSSAQSSCPVPCRC